MKETHTDVNKMLANLKRTLDDLSGNQFEKVRNKFGDLSGNNLKYSSPHYGKGEKFAVGVPDIGLDERVEVVKGVVGGADVGNTVTDVGNTVGDIKNTATGVENTVRGVQTAFGRTGGGQTGQTG